MEVDVHTWTSIATLIVSIFALFPRKREQKSKSEQQTSRVTTECPTFVHRLARLDA
jgi:hypothetical protein